MSFCIYHANDKNIIASANSGSSDKEREEEKLSNMNDFHEINNVASFVQLKTNLKKENNGRLLVQLKIDFTRKKCHIVAYDETRSMIIFDTLPSEKKEVIIFQHKME